MERDRCNNTMCWINDIVIDDILGKGKNVLMSSAFIKYTLIYYASRWSMLSMLLSIHMLHVVQNVLKINLLMLDDGKLSNMGLALKS